MKSGLTIVEMAQQIERQSKLKQDYLLDTRRLQVEPFGSQLYLHTFDDHDDPLVEPLEINQIAHRQIGTHLKIPAAYYDRMLSDYPELLAENVNSWFQREPTQRMVRTLDGTVRAFLSNRYRRIDNLDIAEIVLPVIQQMEDAYFESCQITDSRMYIKVVNKRLEAEVVPGDIVQSGVIISNSEVGLGSVNIQPLVYRLVCSNGMVVNDAQTRRTHIGRVNEADENFQLFSQETLAADDHAFAMKIKDTVMAAVDETRFTRVVGMMREATTVQMNTTDIPGVVRLASKDFNITEEESTGVLQRLIEGKDLTLYGLSNAVTRFSQDVDSYTKAYWVSEEDETSIQAYLNINKKAVEAIRQFQRNVREEQLEQRHRRETDPWDKDMEQVPELPKDWNRWVDKVAIRQNYIYYHYKKGGAKTGYCTYCEKEVPIKVHPHHNQQGRCSCCRHPVVFKAYGRAGYMQTEKHFAYLIQRCKDGFVVREFQADRTYGKESLPNSKLYCQEIRRTIYDRERKPRTYYWGLYKQRNMRWISGSPCSYSWSGSHDGRVYGKTLPTLEQKELRCTGLVNWIRKQKSVDPEKYLAVLERIPQMEQISKVNLPKLIKECFSSCGTVSELIKNHSAGSLIKALGLDSRRFQRLRLHNGGCDLLRWLQYEKGTDREIPDNVLLWMCQQNISPRDVQFIADRMSMVQVYNYVRRQMPSFRRNSHEVLRTWEDYLSMAKKLHMDVYDEIVYRTRKLRRRHDDLVLKCQEKDIELQAEEMEEKFPHVNAICQEIKAKYEYADADYMVVVPDGILDIITEGRALHHCAGSSDRYWDRIERRESFVMFLRKTADPFHAYYTLEVEPDGTVRQKRTEYDRQKKDIEQATEFLQKWQRVITARLTESDKALAAESRILREKEFIQLKKDRVIIHTGHLAGRLLADVLMADLMENTDSIQSPALAAAA